MWFWSVAGRNIWNVTGRNFYHVFLLDFSFHWKNIMSRSFSYVLMHFPSFPVTEGFVRHFFECVNWLVYSTTHVHYRKKKKCGHSIVENMKSKTLEEFLLLISKFVLAEIGWVPSWSPGRPFLDIITSAERGGLTERSRNSKHSALISVASSKYSTSVMSWW